MHLRILFSVVLSFVALFVSAQTDGGRQGSLVVHADSRLDSLVSAHKKWNAEKQCMPGFRVQLYFGGDRKKANELRTVFLQKYPDVSAYVIYQQPNYKVRVGDFRTRLEAYTLHADLVAEYPSAFVVKDEVALPAIK